MLRKGKMPDNLVRNCTNIKLSSEHQNTKPLLSWVSMHTFFLIVESVTHEQYVENITIIREIYTVKIMSLKNPF